MQIKVLFVIGDTGSAHYCIPLWEKWKKEKKYSWKILTLDFVTKFLNLNKFSDHFIKDFHSTSSVEQKIASLDWEPNLVFSSASFKDIEVKSMIYAKQRNIYLRNLIARSELSAADYYLKIDAHVGAIRRANYVIENIPNSSENYRALKILEESYEALGYMDLLEDIKQILNSNYSDKESDQSPRTREWSWNFLDRPDKKDE